MFWDKKERRLPDLPQPRYATGFPPARGSHEVENNFEDDRVHELPSFPDSPMKRGFSQSAIKDAVSSGHRENQIEERLPSNQEPEEELPRLPETSNNHSEKRFGLREMEEWSPQNSNRHTLPSFDEDDELENIAPVKRMSETKPVFVKIDKFRSARDSLAKVESGLQEIEDLLHHIREVKAKEDQELSEWEKDMENVKSRISNVLADVFERAEA